MTALTPTPKLDAVNQLLRAVGEAPVTTIAGIGGLDTANALLVLDQVLRSVLLEGWQFNTEYDYPLLMTADDSPGAVFGTGTITLPENALSVDINRDAYPGVDPVWRGGKLYDRQNHTQVFNQMIKAKVIFMLDFEDLPESARYYITHRACREFQDATIGSEALHRYTAASEMRARATFIEQHADDEDLNMIRSTPEFWHLT